MSMKKNQSKKPNAAAGEDHISELPDEILHSILRRIPKQAPQTIALSRRWRSIWRSYPFVEFDPADRHRCEHSGAASVKMMVADVKNFAIAAINRFSRNNLLPMETLNLSLTVNQTTPARFPVVEQLLDLASERKAQDVRIIVVTRSWLEPELCFPFRLLSNPSVKTLKFEGIAFTFGDAPLSLNSLRSLDLHTVTFENDQLLAKLIASSPLLETLKLRYIGKLMKLQVCNVPELKTLEISSWDTLQEIEITAPGLGSFCLYETVSRFRGFGFRQTDNVLKIGLIAPQLEVLTIGSSRLFGGAIANLISNLESLKFLTLHELNRFENKVKLSCPGLEEFRLLAPEGLEEIVLDAGSGMKKFWLRYDSWPGKLKRCDISNATAVCRWEVELCTVINNISEEIHEWLVQFRIFMARFPEFRSVYIRCYNSEVTIREVDRTLLPLPIEHLKVRTGELTKIDQIALLDGLFWVCRPRVLTLIHGEYDEGGRLFRVFLSQRCRCEPSTNDNGDRCECDECKSWQCELKHVKIIARDVDKIVEEEEIEEEAELMDVSDDAVASLQNPNLVSFMLTWY